MEWISIEDTPIPLDDFKDCLVLFENGDILRYDECLLPLEGATHYLYWPDPPTK